MKKQLTLFSTLALFLALSASAVAQPTIDGIISSGEWDAYYLGTSVTSWGGGGSTDVYGYTDATYLYAAYVADMTQPGWATAAGLGLTGNFYFKTPTTITWPEAGYTIIGPFGDGYGRTDGSDWSWPDGYGNGDWPGRGIEFVAGNSNGWPTVGTPSMPAGPNANVVEIKIPLAQITYAGDDGRVGLTGQYWSYDFADYLYVDLPGPESVLDHFQCYQAVGAPVDTEVNLLDQFSDTTKLVMAPRSICVPVDKDGKGILNEAAHLTCYEVTPSESVNKDVEMSNQFGDAQLLSVQQPQVLCVPSTKVVIGDTPIPPASCADGKPLELVFEYTGDSCAETTNFQDGKFQCNGDPAGAAPVDIVVAKDAQKFIVSPAGGLNVGDLVSISKVDGHDLGKELKLEVQQGGTVLQELKIHTSCSKPLDINDQFGSLILRYFIPKP